MFTGQTFREGVVEQGVGTGRFGGPVQGRPSGRVGNVGDPMRRACHMLRYSSPVAALLTGLTAGKPRGLHRMGLGRRKRTGRPKSANLDGPHRPRAVDAGPGSLAFRAQHRGVRVEAFAASVAADVAVGAPTPGAAIAQQATS